MKLSEPKNKFLKSEFLNFQKAQKCWNKTFK